MKLISYFTSFFYRKKPNRYVNIIGLTVAFAVFIFILLFVNNELNFDKFVANGDRIFRIEEGEFNQVPSAISKLAKQNLDEIENTATVKSFDNHWISYNKNIFEIEDFCFTENSFFKIFPIPFVVGNPETALDAPFKIVLSETLAKNIFGSKNPIGELVNFKNEDYYTVTGVIKDLPDFHLPVKAIASYKSLESRYNLPEYNWYWGLVTYVMLKEKQNPDMVEEKLNVLLNEKNEQWEANGSSVFFRPFNDIYLSNDTYGNDETKHGNASLLIILTVIGVFIVLIASVNYINLSVSYGIRKSNDLIVRRILGSTKRNFIFSQILQSCLSIFISILLAFSIVSVFLNSFESLIGKELNVASFISIKNAFILITVILTLSIIYGLLPALILLKVNSFQSVKSSLVNTKHSGFNSTLVIFQYALSIILICGTIITYKQLNYIKKSDLGFNKDQVVSIELTPELKKNPERFKEELAENSNILGVSFASNNITQFNEYALGFSIDNHVHIFNSALIDPEFIPLMEFNLIQGENFSLNKKSLMTEGYIANETAWNILKNSSLKDKNYELDNRILIGVIKDFHFESFHTRVNPLIFYGGNNENYNNAFVKLTGGNISQAITHIENTFEELDPESLCKYHFVNDAVNNMYHSENVMSRLLGIFTLIAIFIAGIGIISLSALTIESRIKEIGIRKVNGAKVSTLLSMLNKNYIKWVLIAFVISVPVSWFIMNKWLSNFMYKTELNWWLFALAGMLALGIALLTVSWQSWQAATRNPVDALKYE